MAQALRGPFPLRLCGGMIELAAWLVPAEQREDWKREWRAELWHRWQFLLHAGAWDGKERLLLVRRTAGAFADAFWQLTGQEAVQSSLREGVRSPWTCLGGLLALLVAFAVLTLGLPATRNMIQVGTSGRASRLVFIWFHPSAGGGDEGLPPDAAAAWATRSQLLTGLAPFAIGHQTMRTQAGVSSQPLVVRTLPNLFEVLEASPRWGQVPRVSGVLLSDGLARSLFGSGEAALGAQVQIGREWRRIAGVLPADFGFLSRQKAAYLIQPSLPDPQLMIVGRVKPGVTEEQLDHELTRITETACYYFFRSQLRYSFVREAAWMPVEAFAIAAFASALLVLAVSRISWRRLRTLFRSDSGRRFLPQRASFLAVKLILSYLLVFVAVLEWSRSPSAIVYGSRDPAAGPFLLWLYIVGTMGVLFWALADQRARCRVCLRLLSFPVRVGCPGCLLLNWSGTELLCSEGHGLLHVPHMTPSWDEESDRWISLDDSWKDLFAGTKH